MQRRGLNVCEGTLTGTFKALLFLLEPLYRLLMEVSRRASHWHVDETGWLNFVQVPGKEGHRWWLWVFVSEVVVFVLDPSRSGNVPLRYFGPEAKGIVNTDRYPGYFVDHPEVPMDNNEAERALRSAVLGRKNYYGTHSLWSGQLAAVCMSIFQTAVRHGLHPEGYLRYYLDNCKEGSPPPDLEQFLPWNIPDDVLREKSP